ncbi:MAG TPA: hypothetical protein VIM56_16840, partial [Rhizomicrobium sp.]
MANSKRKIWIGASVLVLAAAGVLYAGGIVPPRGETAGTIAPADRYQDSQVSSSDVKTGDQSTAKMMQTDSFQGPSTSSAAQQAQADASAQANIAAGSAAHAAAAGAAMSAAKSAA